jgi:hypothetical protein
LSYSHVAYPDYGGTLFDRFPALAGKEKFYQDMRSLFFAAKGVDVNVKRCPHNGGTLQALLCSAQAFPEKIVITPRRLQRKEKVKRKKVESRAKRKNKRKATSPPTPLPPMP